MCFIRSSTMENISWSPKYEIDVDAMFDDFFNSIYGRKDPPLVDLTLDEKLPWNPPPLPQPPAATPSTSSGWSTAAKRHSSSMEDEYLEATSKRQKAWRDVACQTTPSTMSLEEWLEYIEELVDWEISILPNSTNFELECLHRERLAAFVRIYQERTAFDRFPWFSLYNCAQYYKNKYGHFF